VDTEKGKELAKEFSIPFMETSAKSNINVDNAFFALATLVFFFPLFFFL